MKKILFAIVTFIFVGMTSVFATSDPITLTQADFTEAKNFPDTTTSKGVWYHENGSDKLYILNENDAYILDGEINLNDGAGEIQVRNNNLTLNSNVVLTGGIKTESSTTNTISGSGAVSGTLKQFGGTMTVNGSIIFNGPAISANANMTTINGGTFNNGFEGKQNTEVTINGGTFKSNTDSSSAIDVRGYSVFTINDGTFIGEKAALASLEAGDVTINGGTFTGGAAGIFVASDTKLSGGTFKTTGESDINGGSGAIAIGDFLTFEDMLEDGYIYTTSTEFTVTSDIKFLNVSETTVKLPTTDEEEEETTETEEANPKTGDNIMFYVSTLGLSVLGLAGTITYTKRFG